MSENDTRQGLTRRELGLDLVRAAACVLVLGVHFFLNSGFYDVPMTGGALLAGCMARMVCMTCVPLFLLLTGYTCIRREWSPGYYRKLAPVLLTYILAGAACVAFRILVLGESLSAGTVIRSFFSYDAAPYAWYIHMYIGLFLLSPFVNAAWKNLSKGGRRALLLTLVVLTALPGSVNRWGYILPYWWVEIYPLTYYVAGAWLREYPLKAKSWKLLLGCGALVALTGLSGYLSAQGGSYGWMPEDNWSSWSLLIQAALIFTCLSRVKQAPRPLSWCISRLAKLSLGIYLISWIADQLVYPRLIAAVPAAHTRVFWMPLTVLATVTLSCLMAQVIEWARQGITWCINKICPKAELR